MLFKIIALISGILFGTGMMVSGMVDPVKVLGFLDITGAWDPSLAFVMGGGLLVFMPAYFIIIRKREKPVYSNEFKLNNDNTIDKRLIIGAVLFGLGWGIAGICPGPAITSIGSAQINIVLFVISMVSGSFVAHRLFNKKVSNQI